MTNIRSWIGRLGLLFAVIVVIAIIAVACLYKFNPTTVVLIVRHAEKAETPADDPPLNVAGQARAQTLVHVVGDAGVTAIYSSEYLRTQQTAQPLATHLRIPINEVDAADVDGLVASLRSDHKGEAVLIVGHSNTVAQIIQKLGGGAIAPIAENEYDNLFIVVVPRFGRTKVIHLRYGIPS